MISFLSSPDVCKLKADRLLSMMSTYRKTNQFFIRAAERSGFETYKIIDRKAVFIMANKKKALGVASALALGAGAAYLAKKAKENGQQEGAAYGDGAVKTDATGKSVRTTSRNASGSAAANSDYRNTELGKHEKNSKGICYTNGNYEAFARPKKPEGVDEKNAYIVGSGLASLAAACFLVRDGQMPGSHIHILEAMDIAGGACDGIFDPTRGYVMRGGREMENHFECLWDLFRSIPSLETRGASVLDECNGKPWQGRAHGWKIQSEPERLHGDHEAVYDKGRGSV